MIVLILSVIAAALAAAGFLWLAGVYNQLVTLHKRAWDAWREIHAEDLKAVEIISKAGGAASSLCPEFEVASYRSAAMLGDRAAASAAAVLRERLYAVAPSEENPAWRSRAEAALQSYRGFAGAYNAGLLRPAGRAVALAARLRSLPEI